MVLPLKIQVTENVKPFILYDENAIKKAINRSKEFQKYYKEQNRIISTQKKKFSPFKNENSKSEKTTWITDY